MKAETPPSGTLLLASLERRVPRQTFETWFKPLTVDASAKEEVFRFSAPNPVVKEWVVNHYNEVIRQSLHELSLDHYRIEWSLSAPAKNSENHQVIERLAGSSRNPFQNDDRGREEPDPITALSE